MKSPELGGSRPQPNQSWRSIENINIAERDNDNPDDRNLNTGNQNDNSLNVKNISINSPNIGNQINTSNLGNQANTPSSSIENQPNIFDPESQPNIFDPESQQLANPINQNINTQPITPEDKTKLDAAEANILEKHSQKVEDNLARAALRLFESTKRRNANTIDGRPQKKRRSLSRFYSSEKIFGETQIPEQATEAEHDIDRVEEIMGEFIRREVMDSAREYFSLQKDLDKSKLMLRIAMGEPGEQRSDAEEFNREHEILAARNDIRQTSQRLEALPERSPESHVIVHGYEFRKHIKEVRNGEMVTTPYVARHLERLEENMTSGRPTFVHGHLGSGKTELAIMAAKHSMISREAYDEAWDEIDRFEDENPTATDAECGDMMAKFYRKNLARLEHAVRSGDSAATERFAPLVISGSKDLTSQDLYVDKTLKLAKFNGKPLLEHKKDLDDEIAKWFEAHPEDAKNPDKAKSEADKIIDIYKLKNQAFGTEVETIKQALYRGVEEGRPVIIDEVNAIPAAVLISMNDILQRRPGQNCYIPGAGSVRIKEGFSITMTGNLSSGNIDYVGTEDLNTAMLSRLDVIEHDYLPMSDTDANYRNQTDPSQNELFQVMIASLARKTGDLRLPEMDKSLDKLFKLAQFAHATQQVFEGKWRESNMNLTSDSGDEMEPSLKKSVLSIRNILNVLRDWDKGLREKDLDKALWDSFISTMTNPDDQNFALALARQYGFFSESDGWQVSIKERGSGFTNLAEIHPGEFNHHAQPLESLDLRKVVDVLYGDRPERTAYPELDLDAIEDTVDDELTIEDFAEIEGRINEITKVISALNRLGEQYGCSVADAPGNNSSPSGSSASISMGA